MPFISIPHFPSHSPDWLPAPLTTLDLAAYWLVLRSLKLSEEHDRLLLSGKDTDTSTVLPKSPQNSFIHPKMTERACIFFARQTERLRGKQKFWAGRGEIGILGSEWISEDTPHALLPLFLELGKPVSWVPPGQILITPQASVLTLVRVIQGSSSPGDGTLLMALWGHGAPSGWSPQIRTGV